MRLVLGLISIICLLILILTIVVATLITTWGTPIFWVLLGIVVVIGMVIHRLWISKEV